MADVNPTGIDELEEKKWLISRIDLYHDAITEEVQNDMLKFENTGEQLISKLRSYRSFTLSSLGVFLTVLLGTNSIFQFQQWAFFVVLTGLGVTGLIVIIFFNLLIRSIENIFAKINEIFTEGIGNLVYSHGFMVTSMSKLSETTLKFIQNYQIFSMLLTFAIYNRTAKSLKQMAEQYSNFPQIKSMLLEEAKNDEEQNQYIPHYYERLDRTQRVPLGLMKMIDATLADYRPTTNRSAV